MATAKVEIISGVIVNHNSVYLSNWSDDRKSISINGWEVEIRDSRIICHAERNYSDGPHICHREFKLADGTLGLAGGNIDQRYVYFRVLEFQEFLNKFGITAVKREDPNQVFSGFSTHSGWGDASLGVVTDGITSGGFEADGSGVNNSLGLWSGMNILKVTGATWTIVRSSENYRDNHNGAVLLYTLQPNVMSLAASLEAALAQKA